MSTSGRSDGGEGPFKRQSGLGELVREARQRLFLSQKDLAKRAAVAPATVFRLEKGSTARIQKATLVRLARALEMPSTRLEAAARGETCVEESDKVCLSCWRAGTPQP